MDGMSEKKKEKEKQKQEVKAERTLGDNVDAYRELAQNFSRKAAIMRPSQMTGQARRMHVRDTILEDHAVRIDQ